MLFFRVCNYSAKVQIIYQLANLLISKLGSAHSSLILRLSFALPVSFIYRLYRVDEKEKKSSYAGG